MPQYYRPDLGRLTGAAHVAAEKRRLASLTPEERAAREAQEAREDVRATNEFAVLGANAVGLTPLGLTMLRDLWTERKPFEAPPLGTYDWWVEKLGGNLADPELQALDEKYAVLQLPLMAASAPALVRGAKHGAKWLGRTAREKLPEMTTKALGKLGPLQAMTPLYAVKPKGGDWFGQNLDDYINEVNFNRLGIDNEPMDKALSAWNNKQLKRWVKTYLGTAEDPLLELERRGELPFSLESMENYLDSTFAKEHQPPIDAGGTIHHRLTGRRRRTPYEQFADSLVLQNKGGNLLSNHPWSPFSIDEIQRYYKQGFPMGSFSDGEEYARAKKDWFINQPSEEQWDFKHDLEDVELPKQHEHVYKDPHKLLYDTRIDFNEWDPLQIAHINDYLEQHYTPEQLARISFPEAARGTALWDKKLAEAQRKAALQATQGLATRIFKEYPENNPQGLRWVELALPAPELPEGFRVAPSVRGEGLFNVLDAAGKPVSVGATENEALGLFDRATRRQQLADALRYEGNTMGHCVGGYCDDVVRGRSRIFSLRDAKGEPHVTIETKPGLKTMTEAEQAFFIDNGRMPRDMQELDDWGIENEIAIDAGDLSPNQQAHYIDQIKGKQNRAPNPEYLPFVQDFVRSQEWSRVGDLHNTGLRQIGPKYFTPEEFAKAIGDRKLGPDMSHYNALYPQIKHGDVSGIDPEDLQVFRNLGFEDFAAGGAVESPEVDDAALGRLLMELE